MSFLIALGLGLVGVPLARWAGSSLGVVDRPSDPSLKIHAEAVPLLGGAAAVGCALGAVALRHAVLPRPVLGAIGLAFAGGLLDDLRPLPAWPRLILQSAVGVLLVAGGVRLAPLGPFDAVGVVLLVIATTNAVNILDGQDGLAGGVAAIAAAGFAGLALWAGPSIVVGLGLSLAGGLVAFLVWNVTPAKIFLGNGGAYAVGTVLAVLAARTSAWYGWRGLVASALCLGVFAFELASTVVRRMASRRPLSGGDRTHSYDLLAGSVGRGASTALFWGLGVAAAGLAALALRLSLPGRTGVAASAVAAALVAGALLWRAVPSREVLRNPP